MNIKELLMKQNVLSLIGRALNMFDEGEKEFPGYYTTLREVEEITPIKDAKHLVYGYKCREMYDGVLEERTDFSTIYLDDLKKMKTDGVINEFSDTDKLNYPESYSMMFVDWAEILGYRVAVESFEVVDELDLAAALLYELTFFGYDYEENQERVEEETFELERRVAAIDEGDIENCTTLDDVKDWILEMRKESGEFDGKTEEEITEILKREEKEREKEIEQNKVIWLEDLQKRYEFLKRLKDIYCKEE